MENKIVIELNTTKYVEELDKNVKCHIVEGAPCRNCCFRNNNICINVACIIEDREELGLQSDKDLIGKSLTFSIV